MVYYISSVLLISVLYCPVIYKLLGPHRYGITAALLLLCLLAEAIFWCLGKSWGILLLPALVLLVCLAVNLEEWQQLRSNRQLAKLPPRKQSTTTLPFTLSREDMLSNFRELATKDEMANYDPANNFLAWNDEQGSDIRIHLLPGEDWVALLYLTSYELRNSEIKAACEKAGIPCHKDLLGMAPSGLAIFHDGQLTLTPATQKKRFSELLTTVLAPRAEFAVWLANYTEEA